MVHDQIIVAVFPSRRILKKALDHLLEDVAIEVQEAAVVVKSKTGKILVLNDGLGANDWGLVSGIVGTLVGAIAIAGLGVFAVPAGNLFTVLAFGAVLGGIIGWITGQLVARVFSFGFAKPYAGDIADKLQSGHTALMLRVEDAAELLPKLKDELKPYRAELVTRLRELQTTITS